MFTFVIEIKIPPCIKLPPYCPGSTNVNYCAAHMWFCFVTKCQDWIVYQSKFKKVFIAFTSCPCRMNCILSICLGFHSYPWDSEILDLSGRHWNTGLVSCELSLTSWEEGISLALIVHRPSDDVTIIIPYGVDVLLQLSPSHPIFFWWVD